MPELYCRILVSVRILSTLEKFVHMYKDIFIKDVYYNIGKVEKWKHSKCLLIEEWLSKLWYICIMEQ